MDLDSLENAWTLLLSRMDLVSWLVATVNIVLLVFARKLVALVYHADSDSATFKRRLMIFRALNLLILIAFGYFRFYLPAPEKGFGLKLVAISVNAYLGYLGSHLASFLIIRRYGKSREVKGQMRRVDTYNTRLMSLFVQVFIFVIVLISSVRILGFDTLLEAGGVIGFIGVFLALTSNVWAPDLFSGLIILNSNLIQEGDVIVLKDSDEIYGTVYKTKVFHTEILDLVGNYRVMVRNSVLRHYLLRNYSKFASAKGLRDQLFFKIGYDVDPDAVIGMFEDAFERVRAQKETGIQAQNPMEVAIHATGDHAVEWVVSYYTKDVDRLPQIRRFLLSVILQCAGEGGISLATPLTHEVHDPSRAEVEDSAS